MDEADDTPLFQVSPELDDAAEREQEMLDSLRLSGFPSDELQRREAWMQLPRETRAAIRRLHNMMGHKPKAVLLRLLRGARASPDLIEAVKQFRCDTCAELQAPKAVPAVKAPSPYEFNYEVLIDVVDIKDDNGSLYGVLHIICNGTTAHNGGIVCEGKGVPKSSACWKKFRSK